MYTWVYGKLHVCMVLLQAEIVSKAKQAELLGNELKRQAEVM